MSNLSKLTTKELFAIALSTPIYDEDSDTSWNAVVELQKRGTRKIYRKAWKLCHSKKIDKRQVGASVLAQSVDSETYVFHKRRLKWLIRMSEGETDPGVLMTVISGLGRFQRKKANRALLYLRYHDSSRVRFGVTVSLNDLDYDYREIVDALIELSVDDDAHVREWATYRLRLLEFDSETIREALYARLSDSDDNVRGEAVAGLARRKDQRVFKPLMKALEETPLSSFALEAAEALADARLLPTLYKLQENWTDDGIGWDYKRLQTAIAACEGKPGED